MKTQEIKFTVLFLILIGIGFNEPIKGQTNGWSEEKHVVKKITNVTFIIPVGGKTFENKDALVTECFDAIKSNLELINIPKLKDSIYIRFLSDRDEMKRYTTTRSIGFTVPWTKTVYIVDSYKKGEVKAPIKHELMHLISNREWGRPPENSYWMNEGLATYAENNCNNYNVEQIYRFFLGNKMLISIDSLANDFYNQSEMIAYHQSAYIVEYLITNYGIKKFEELWKEGIDEFEKIYSLPVSQILKDIEKVAIEKYPTSPDIDWGKFKKGCK